MHGRAGSLAAWLCACLAASALSLAHSDTADARGEVRAAAPAPSALAAVHARKTRNKGTSAKASLTLVRDLRLKDYPDHTRVVLELQRSTSFTQSRVKNPDRVLIELQNTRLSETARRRLTEQTLPHDIIIEQPHARSVTVSLNLTTVSDYKLLPLRDPTRLVIDVFPRTARQAAARPAPPVTQVPAQAVVPPSASVPSISNAPRSSRAEVKTIVVDPGHGGKDPGAVGRTGLTEKDITLEVGLRLKELLTSRLGKQVLMTRERDAFVELEDRATFANKHDADLFISIHVNSHPHRSTKGLEVYHFGEATDRRALEVAARENGTPIKDTGVGWEYLVADLLTTKKVQESLELAWSTKQAMVSHLDGHYDVVDHGVKTAPFYVLRFTSMPSILTEIAFITNPTEERQMQSDAYLIRMAQAIFDGIKRYIFPLQTASR